MRMSTLLFLAWLNTFLLSLILVGIILYLK
jgi:hypothetical protein